MKFLKYLNEEYVMRISDGRNSYEIFVNPDKGEIINELKKFKFLRFIIEPYKKKFYVWDDNLLHEYVYNTLKIHTKFLFGTLSWKNGKFALYNNLIDMEENALIEWVPKEDKEAYRYPEELEDGYINNLFYKLLKSNINFAWLKRWF
jgi:hypothetical protein